MILRAFIPKKLKNIKLKNYLRKVSKIPKNKSRIWTKHLILRTIVALFKILFHLIKELNFKNKKIRYKMIPSVALEMKIKLSKKLISI